MAAIASCVMEGCLHWAPIIPTGDDASASQCTRGASGETDEIGSALVALPIRGAYQVTPTMHHPELGSHHCLVMINRQMQCCFMCGVLSAIWAVFIKAACWGIA